MKLKFASLAWADYIFWQTADTTILFRINVLIEECRRHPFSGTGKPEALKGNLSGFWSRRITAEHRLVYRVSGSGDNQILEIAQCRHHY
ncbi:Txe/YoeB family addiction module toxin [Cypionkella aquatica]|uniref:Txe/YoeB family addiction module toxin n=1 Tax=Cypionkella aquatica TaxID=1756042 RepID=UPI0024E17A16|nr:Txe/YoeB family addiction module toxin [Cypionkella aquatica]